MTTLIHFFVAFELFYIFDEIVSAAKMLEQNQCRLSVVVRGDGGFFLVFFF